MSFEQVSRDALYYAVPGAAPSDIVQTLLDKRLPHPGTHEEVRRVFNQHRIYEETVINKTLGYFAR